SSSRCDMSPRARRRAKAAFALRLALGEMSHLLLDSTRVSPRRAQEGYVFRFASLSSALQDALR
ncbi:MAG: DUF1731 domain-containing protein, partial [Verrucomicrobiota bacterium]